MKSNKEIYVFTLLEFEHNSYCFKLAAMNALEPNALTNFMSCCIN